MEQHLPQRACPLCGSGRGWLIRPLRYALFDDLGLSGSSPLLACASCGFVFNDLGEDPSILAAYYRGHDHYLISTTAGSGGSTPVEIARYDRLLQRLDQWLDPTRIILDVGCGKGGFLLHLRERGYSSLLGLEASSACRHFAAEKSGLAVVEHVGQLPKTPSIVVISHVLEHLYDPLAFLRELVLSAEPSAVFYIEVPNSPALFDAAVPWSWLYFEHINHFDRSHLLAMARLAGLVPITDSTWSFQPGEGNETDCLYVLCQKGSSPLDRIEDLNLAVCFDSGLSKRPVPQAKIEAIQSSGRHLILWGLSQYAMLILGMHPEILDRLYVILDASPAKINRQIHGMTVMSPDLSREYPLNPLFLLPQSAYTEAIIALLTATGKPCSYLIV